MKNRYSLRQHSLILITKPNISKPGTPSTPVIKTPKPDNKNCNNADDAFSFFGMEKKKKKSPRILRYDFASYTHSAASWSSRRSPGLGLCITWPRFRVYLERKKTRRLFFFFFFLSRVSDYHLACKFSVTLLRE